MPDYREVDAYQQTPRDLTFRSIPARVIVPKRLGKPPPARISRLGRTSVCEDPARAGARPNAMQSAAAKKKNDKNEKEQMPFPQIEHTSTASTSERHTKK